MVVNVAEEDSVLGINDAVIVAGEFVQHLALREENPPHGEQNAFEGKQPLQCPRRGFVEDVIFEFVNRRVDPLDGGHVSCHEKIHDLVQ